MEMQNEGRPILVYGATGAQGGPVARALLQAGHRVRVLVRDGQKAEALRQAGAEIAIGDLSDRGSLLAANEGVAAVFLHLPIVPDELYAPFGENAVTAAELAHVPYMVFSTSGPTPDRETPLGQIEGKRAMVDRIRRGSVPTAILKPTVFTQNLIAPWSLPALVNDGVLAYPHPEDMLTSWITHEDVAAAVAAIITRPELAGQTFHLGGPEALRGNELAARFSAALERPVQYVGIAPDDFAASLRPVMGDAANEVGNVYRWMTAEGRGELLVENMDVTARQLGYTPTPLADWLRSVQWSTPAEVSQGR
jgi:uncharacterized protein YbjT (DUF2867 family)